MGEIEQTTITFNERDVPKMKQVAPDSMNELTNKDPGSGKVPLPSVKGTTPKKTPETDTGAKKAPFSLRNLMAKDSELTKTSSSPKKGTMKVTGTMKTPFSSKKTPVKDTGSKKSPFSSKKATAKDTGSKKTPFSSKKGAVKDTESKKTPFSLRKLIGKDTGSQK